MERAAAPGERVEHADRQQQHRAGRNELQPIAGAQQHDTEQHHGNGGVLQPDRRRQHRERGRLPHHPRAAGGRAQAQRQQRQQRRGGHELGQRLVREPGQLIPEGAGQQRHPRRGLAEVAAREPVHGRGNRQRQRAEHQLDAADVPPRMAQADGVEQLQHAGHHPRHQPGTRAVEVLPVDHAVAERQAVGGLQVLHDLIRVQDEVAGQRYRRACRERQRQHQRQQFPRRLVGRARVDQAVEQGVQQRRTWLCRGAPPPGRARRPGRPRRGRSATTGPCRRLPFRHLRPRRSLPFSSDKVAAQEHQVGVVVTAPTAGVAGAGGKAGLSHGRQGRAAGLQGGSRTQSAGTATDTAGRPVLCGWFVAAAMLRA